MPRDAPSLLASVWSAPGGDGGAARLVAFEGPAGGLPSIYPASRRSRCCSRRRRRESAALDLRARGARATFEALVGQADVVVNGYRRDALERLGLSDAALRALNPALAVASLDAYGHTGPWRDGRGFDSLVQMSCGMAAAGRRAANAEVPVPLPAQALDHGTGYLLAAAVCRGLTRRVRTGEASTVRASLARTARFLTDLGEAPIARDRELAAQEVEPYLETVESAWGPLARVRPAGRVEGTTPGWSRPPGPLGTDPPAW